MSRSSDTDLLETSSEFGIRMYISASAAVVSTEFEYLHEADSSLCCERANQSFHSSGSPGRRRICMQLIPITIQQVVRIVRIRQSLSQ